MNEQVFATPQDAEDAFYRAFESADLAAMMAVWSHVDYAECIHPMSERIIGYVAIQDSWRNIFLNTTDIRFEVLDRRQIQHLDLAIHIVNENILIQDDVTKRVSILATNIFEKSAQGWHMILHHASPSPRHQENTEQTPIMH